MTEAHRQSERKRLASAASVVGLSTSASRILGFIRDAAVAYVFGAGLASDAFFVAFRISNMLRRLLGEGALTSSFIPIFTEEKKNRSHEQTRALVSSVATFFFIALVVISLLGMAFSEEIVRLMSPGFTEDEEKFRLTVNLTAIMFPYILTVGLMAIAMGVLNSMRHFAAPAISPVFFNLAIILAVFVICPSFDVPIYGLAIGVLLGGVVQLAVHLPTLDRFGFMPKISFNFKDPVIKKIFLLMGPAALGVGVYQLNIFVTLWFASQQAEGSVSYLYYAGRLLELPLGVFGVAISTAALPSLSAYAANKDWTGLKDSFSYSLRLVNFISLPAMIGLMVLSGPIIDVLFRHGEFGQEASSMTASALWYYALGLVPIASARILVSVFYSIKDTITPVYCAGAAFLANMALCIALTGPMGHNGLALATSISSLANMCLLIFILRRRFGQFGGKAIAVSGLKALVASAIMGFVVYSISNGLANQATGTGPKALILAICLAAGGVSFFGFARFLKVQELEIIRSVIKR